MKDLFGVQGVPILGQIEELKRELSVRQRVYPRWVDGEKIKPEVAEWRMMALEGAIEILQGIVDAEQKRSRREQSVDPRSVSQVHSGTSLEAARAMTGKADGIRRQVFDYLVSVGWLGSTDEEATRALKIPHRRTTIGARRIELMRLGLVRDSGKTRKNVSGQDAVVWVSNVLS